MDLRRRLLWVDGAAGATAGVVVLVAYPWLSRLYQLPSDLLIWMAVANLAYATFSLSLARRPKRPPALIRLLVLANLVWAVACLRWATLYGDVATPWGIAHLVGEALIVGGLACLEWRWRSQLETA